MWMLPTERDSLWSEAGQSLLAGSSRHWEQPGLPLRELGMEAFPMPAPRLRCGWDKRGFGKLQRSAIRILVPGKLSQDGVLGQAGAARPWEHPFCSYGPSATRRAESCHSLLKCNLSPCREPLELPTAIVTSRSPSFWGQ